MSTLIQKHKDALIEAIGTRFNDVQEPQVVGIVEGKVTNHLLFTVLPSSLGGVSVGVFTYDKTDTAKQREAANYTRFAQIGHYTFTF